MLIGCRSSKLSLFTRHSCLSKFSSIGSPIVVEAKKQNLPQSPLKMKFLVKLIRGRWVPDAMAQLKFSAKQRAVDVAKIVKRASGIAKIFHDAIPEDLIVKEVIVNKGMQQKRMRIMGRGRTGIGYVRKTHVTVKVEVINFQEKIANSKDSKEKGLWIQRMQIAEAVRNSNISSSVSSNDLPASS